MNRIEMSKAKEILRLKALGFSYREIAASVQKGKTVVGDTLRRARAAGIETAEDYTESQLERLLFPENLEVEKNGLDMNYLLTELGKKYMTRQLLWEEYKEKHPDGLMYSQFCEKIRQAKKANGMTYHKTHKGGEECEVDWAGGKIPYYDLATGETREASIFVAVLPASDYTFVYAYENQKTENWIAAHIRAFNYFGGTPRVLIPDCTKTAVSKCDLYTPELSKTYYEMAKYYDIEIVPARPGKPRDKGSVENAVGNVSRQIIASLRNEKFTSIAEINKALSERLKRFLEREFQKIPGCRRSAFEEIDKLALRPLPKTHYELADFKTCKIGINYHVEYKGYFYSVPYEHRAKQCEIRATRGTIEVFINGERVFTHIRKYKGNRYITVEEHVPPQHKVVGEFNDERFISWAKKYGRQTLSYIEALLASTTYSIQAYRSCMGVLREAEKQPKEIVEAACAKALELKLYSSRYFTSILKTKLKEMGRENDSRVIEHENIRGQEAFKGGVYNA